MDFFKEVDNIYVNIENLSTTYEDKNNSCQVLKNY